MYSDHDIIFHIIQEKEKKNRKIEHSPKNTKTLLSFMLCSALLWGKHRIRVFFIFVINFKRKEKQKKTYIFSWRGALLLYLWCPKYRDPQKDVRIGVKDSSSPLLFLDTHRERKSRRSLLLPFPSGNFPSPFSSFSDLHPTSHFPFPHFTSILMIFSDLDLISLKMTVQFAWSDSFV